MYLLMDENYAEKIALSLYRVNKEAKRLRDNAYFSNNYYEKRNLKLSMREIYSLKKDVLMHLYETGNLEIIGYHILSYDYDENNNYVPSSYGILTRIPYTNNTFHTPIDSDELESYTYGSMDKLGIKCLGELDEISSKIKIKNVPSFNESINNLQNFLRDNWEFNDDYEEYYV